MPLKLPIPTPPQAAKKPRPVPPPAHRRHRKPCQPPAGATPPPSK
jgi:hypothetical protein